MALSTQMLWKQLLCGMDIQCYFAALLLTETSLENEKSKVEDVVINPNYLGAIKAVYLKCQEHQLINLLDSTHKIVIASSRVSKEVSTQQTRFLTLSQLGALPDFISTLKNKLSHENSHVRVVLLKILSALCTKSTNPKNFLREHNLLKIVEFMANLDSSIVVKQIAAQLIKQGT
jgi:hypothetical protein